MGPEKKEMQIVITNRLWQRLGMQAVKYDRNRAQLVRDVLGSWLDREEQKMLGQVPTMAANGNPHATTQPQRQQREPVPPSENGNAR